MFLLNNTPFCEEYTALAASTSISVKLLQLSKAVPTIEVTEAGNYSIIVTSGTGGSRCSLSSAPVNVTVNPGGLTHKPLVSSNSTNNKVCKDGGNVLLTFENPGDFIGKSYSWYKDGYEINPLDTGLHYLAESAGSYQLVVVDAGCAYLSVPVVITVRFG